jgi:signal transduction histidine kinase
MGIDNEALKLLFEPFYTTKRGEGESGLGTHLIYNLVTGSLKGKITVKSQVGKGLAYLIKFPVG